MPNHTSVIRQIKEDLKDMSDESHIIIFDSHNQKFLSLLGSKAVKRSGRPDCYILYR